MSNETTTDGRPPDEVRDEQDREGNVLHTSYVILTEQERAKGYVRPVRRTYRHTECGGLTTMATAIAETYARDPTFYGSTWCSWCQCHCPVGEFVWDGSDESVGS